MNPSPSRWLILPLCCLAVEAVGCGAGQTPTTVPPPDTQQPTNPLANDMLAAHNTARANASPTPQPAMPALTWSEDAATVAQNWANQCKFAHNPDRGPYGENLAAATPPDAETTTQAVESWVAESANYNYADNTCASGKVCGHYTQVVWRNTTQVGCASVTCDTNSPFGSQYPPQWQLWVCDYSPPGNYAGQKPY